MNGLRFSRVRRRRSIAADCVVLLVSFTREVRQGREAIAAMDEKLAQHETLMAETADGKTDVLAWMRTHTKYAVVPAGAVYSADCSRQATGEGAGLKAVFTFAKESPYRGLLRRAAAGDATAREEFQRRRGEEQAAGRSEAAQSVQDFVAGIRSFYRNRGFVDVEGDRPIMATWLKSPDGSVFVDVWEVNPFSGLIPRDTPPVCSELPTGPLVEIHYESVQCGAAGGAAEDAGDASAEAKGAEAAGDKPDSEYERVKETLFLARMDAANLAALELPIPADAPPEVKAELAPLAAQFAVRKANVAVYKRHEAVLEPIFKAFLQTSEE